MCIIISIIINLLLYYVENSCAANMFEETILLFSGFSD